MRLSVKASPRSSVNEVVGFDGVGRLKVKVTAPPVDNKANAAVVELLARHYGVAKSAVQIVSGEGSRTKIIDIQEK